MDRFYVKLDGFGRTSCAYYEAETAESAIQKALAKNGVYWEITVAGVKTTLLTAPSVKTPA